MLGKINNLFRPERLSRRRMLVAVLVAVVADGLQIPFAVPPFPEIIDVIAMVLTSALIGFHVLLLPTFALEFIPMASVLPTWTGCVLAVLALRRSEQKNALPPSARIENESSLPPRLPPPDEPQDHSPR